MCVCVCAWVTCSFSVLLFSGQRAQMFTMSDRGGREGLFTSHEIMKWHIVSPGFPLAVNQEVVKQEENTFLNVAGWDFEQISMEQQLCADICEVGSLQEKKKQNKNKESNQTEVYLTTETIWHRKWTLPPYKLTEESSQPHWDNMKVQLWDVEAQGYRRLDQRGRQTLH